MNAANELTQLVDNLAGHWTEPTLEILKAAGIRRISIEMEVEAWQIIRKVLRSQLRWPHAFQFATLVSLSALMEEVLRKTTMILAHRFQPGSISFEFETRVRRLSGERRSTIAERRVYADLVRQPALRNAFKGPSRSDFVPRLRVSANGG